MKAIYRLKKSGILFALETDETGKVLKSCNPKFRDNPSFLHYEISWNSVAHLNLEDFEKISEINYSEADYKELLRDTDFLRQKIDIDPDFDFKKYKYLTSIRIVCDEVKVRIESRFDPELHEQEESIEDAIKSYHHDVNWAKQSSEKLVSIIEYGIQEYHCPVAESGRLMANAIDEMIRGILLNIERFEVSLPKYIADGRDIKKTFESMQRTYQHDLFMYIKDLLSLQAQAYLALRAMIEEGPSDATGNKKAFQDLLKKVRSNAGSSHVSNNLLKVAIQCLLEGETKDVDIMVKGKFSMSGIFSVVLKSLSVLDYCRKQENGTYLITPEGKKLFTLIHSKS